MQTGCAPFIFATHRHATRMCGSLLTHTMNTKWGQQLYCYRHATRCGGGVRGRVWGFSFMPLSWNRSHRRSARCSLGGATSVWCPRGRRWSTGHVAGASSVSPRRWIMVPMAPSRMSTRSLTMSCSVCIVLVVFFEWQRNEQTSEKYQVYLNIFQSKCSIPSSSSQRYEQTSEKYQVYSVWPSLNRWLKGNNTNSMFIPIIIINSTASRLDLVVRAWVVYGVLLFEVLTLYCSLGVRCCLFASRYSPGVQPI